MRRKHTLVVYFSSSGHTALLANRIATLCHADIERIVERERRAGLRGHIRSAIESLLRLKPPIAYGRYHAAEYDLVILGTPVWFWNMASPVRTWLQRHRHELANVALFCTYGRSGPARALDKLEQLSGRQALARLALRQQAARQSQDEPALHRFLLELRRVRSVSLSVPPMHDQATA